MDEKEKALLTMAPLTDANAVPVQLMMNGPPQRSSVSARLAPASSHSSTTYSPPVDVGTLPTRRSEPLPAIVAAGTSLPEVATSILATIRGERDIAVGNVVGSNIFNVLGVLGLSSILAPTALTVAPSLLRFDLPVMLAVAIACVPVFLNGRRIARWEGALFLGYYVAYATYLVLASKQHDALETVALVMQTTVLPLTALTLLVVLWRAWKAPPTPA